MKKIIKFTIFGEPIGKQRPKFSSAGKFVKAYTPKETINYESLVVQSYKAKEKEINFIPFDVHEEIYATIIAYFKIPKQHYRFHKRTNTLDLDNEGLLMKEGKIRPTKKPDTDNIAKICLDALNGIAYPDDSQIVICLVMKEYSEEPRVEITLENKHEFK